MGLDGFYYTTMQGDTFDILALDAYHDEFLAPVLIAANPAYAQTLVFAAGVPLWIPKQQTAPAESLPPWKRGVKENAAIL